MSARRPWGWAGSVAAFLALDEGVWLDALRRHLVGLTGDTASSSQVDAWRSEFAVMRGALQWCAASRDTSSWSAVFEFELPFEGGRRPDVVVLAGETVVVLEFKSSPLVTAAFIDQASGYGRDLANYHEASHFRRVVPVLVAPVATQAARPLRGVRVASPGRLGPLLAELASEGVINSDAWLTAPYAPLPRLVEAARRIFQHEPLPHVRSARSERIPETVSLVSELIDGAEREGKRRLILLTGVPGAGKTLVGLRVVYERSEVKARATFLSGNGPLVAVLQDALRSRVFVRDLHKFIGSYGTSDRVPEQHVLVFDEAQRAWDAEYMLEKKGLLASEPDLLVGIAERLPGWATLVGLVGTGQEIHSGEEAGLQQWRAAIERHAEAWEVFCPPTLASVFRGLEVATHDDLDLDVPMRSHQAHDIHDWVAALLDGHLIEAEALAARMADQGFPIYLTRSLDEAREYARERYERETVARYGLVTSSHAKNLEDRGVDNSWMATGKLLNVAKWYNAPPDDQKSCCQLRQPVTEFGCQGLELDIPIVCWGDDARWVEDGWKLRPRRRKFPLRDPEVVLRNTYRVLLTRGRDGLVIWVPPDDEMNETADALEIAGARTEWK